MKNGHEWGGLGKGIMSLPFSLSSALSVLRDSNVVFYGRESCLVAWLLACLLGWVEVGGGVASIFVQRRQQDPGREAFQFPPLSFSLGYNTSCGHNLKVPGKKVLQD